MSEKSPISIDEWVDSKSILKSTWGDHKYQLLFAHLNINSIRNKFDLLTEQVAGNIDLLMISETNIDESFPVENFLLPSLVFLIDPTTVQRVLGSYFMFGRIYHQTF